MSRVERADGSGAEFDAVIVGAGPAGSAAAIRLGRAGRRVLLIDRCAFPRSKVCGGCLSGTGTQLLRELLGPGGFAGIPAKSTSFVVGRRRIATGAKGASSVVCRTELDQRLLECAAASGAETVLGRSAEVALEGDRWCARIGTDRIRARLILMAAGVGGLVHKLGIRSRYRGRMMAAQQWTQPPRPGMPALGEAELHWLRGGYVGLATPVEGRVVVGLASILPSRSGGQTQSPFMQLRQLNPRSEVLQALPEDSPRRYGSRGASGFPWWPERVADRNLMLLGDAAGYSEPFTGEGMGMALMSAKLAVESILAGPDPARSYQQAMRRNHEPLLRRTHRLSMLLRATGVYMLSRLAAISPSSLSGSIVAHLHVAPRRLKSGGNFGDRPIASAS